MQPDARREHGRLNGAARRERRGQSRTRRCDRLLAACDASIILINRLGLTGRPRSRFTREAPDLDAGALVGEQARMHPADSRLIGTPRPFTGPNVACFESRDQPSVPAPTVVSKRGL